VVAKFLGFLEREGFGFFVFLFPAVCFIFLVVFRFASTAKKDVASIRANSKLFCTFGEN
jgi:hypothetical protein